MKTTDAIKAYEVLKTAKLTKVENVSDKFELVRTCCALKKIAEQYESDNNEAMERLKGENHDKMIQLAQKWASEEQEGKEVTLTMDERIEVNSYFRDYNKLVTEFISSQDKEIQPEFHKVNDYILSQLIASNDMTIEQIMAVKEVIV